jgi:hypothetical protein
MGNIPLVALQGNPPPSPLDQYAKVQQIKSMMLGQQLSAAELQGHQLENQQRQVALQGMQRVVSAQNDPQWDATDPDKVRQLLTKYSVPVPMQATVMEGIGKMQDIVSGASKESQLLNQKVHNYFDDQFQAAKNAPPDQQETVWQQAKQNAVNFAKKYLPSGPVQQGALDEISKAPALYDHSYVEMQHGLLRTVQDLNEDALKKGQTAEAVSKGHQAEQEAQLTGAKIPGAQAESTMQQQNAAIGPTGRALAGNLPYQAAGGNPQAKQALNLETQQKVAAAQAGVAGSNSALRGVPPHLVAAATGDATKVGQEYADATAAARDMQTFVSEAKAGNKIAYAYSPVEGVLTLNTARGVKRVNMSEIESYGGAGSGLDRVKAFLGKKASGASIPDDVLNDMASLHQAIAANAKQTYGNKLKVINQNYGSSFQPVEMGGTVKMQAPNGQTKDVDPSEVEHYKSMGAKVVQ